MWNRCLCAYAMLASIPVVFLLRFLGCADFFEAFFLFFNQSLACISKLAIVFPDRGDVFARQPLFPTCGFRMMHACFGVPDASPSSPLKVFLRFLAAVRYTHQSFLAIGCSVLIITATNVVINLVFAGPAVFDDFPAAWAGECASERKSSAAPSFLSGRS